MWILRLARRPILPNPDLPNLFPQSSSATMGNWRLATRNLPPTTAATHTCLRPSSSILLVTITSELLATNLSLASPSLADTQHAE